MPDKLLTDYDKSAVASAELVFKQITSLQERQYSDEPSPDKVLYHYTSAEGLKESSRTVNYGRRPHTT